jgi:hypothetical protein
MKNSYIPAILLTSLVFFTQCKKDSGPVNQTLYDKPLEQIQSVLAGKWKLHYAGGGWTPMTLFTDNIVYTFSPQRIVIEKNAAVQEDTVISWVRGMGMTTGGADTYLLNYTDRSGQANSFVVRAIVNDTLLLDVNWPDSPTYHLTKSP